MSSFSPPGTPVRPTTARSSRASHLLQALGQRHEVTLLSFAFDTARSDQPGELAHCCRDIRVVASNPFEVNQANTLRTFLSLHPVASRPIPAMCDLVNQLMRQEPFNVVIASTAMMADYALMLPESVTRDPRGA